MHTCHFHHYKAGLILATLLIAACGTLTGAEPEGSQPAVELSDQAAETQSPIPPDQTELSSESSPMPLPPVRTATPTPTFVPQPTPTPTFVLEPTPAVTLEIATHEPTEPEEVQPPVPIPLLTAGQRVRIRDLHMITTTQGWAIGEGDSEDSHILLTEDGGETWTDVSPPELGSTENDSIWAQGSFLDARHAWVIYAPSYYGGARGVWRTEDGGATWERGLSRLGFQNGIGPASPEIAFLDTTTGWLIIDAFHGAGSTGTDIFRSDDGGERWQLVMDEYRYRADSPMPGPVDGMDFVDPQHGWATESHPYVSGVRVYWTADGGESWRRQELPQPEEDPDYLLDTSCRGLSPTLFSRAMGAVWVDCEHRDRDFIYLTRDEGVSWDINALPADFDAASVAIIDQNRLFAIGWWIEWVEGESQILGSELYRSGDGGSHWTLIAEMDWAGTLQFLDERHGWAFGGSEAEPFLMRTSDGGHSWRRLSACTSDPTDRSPAIERLAPLVLPGELAVLKPENIGEMRLVEERQLDPLTDLAFTPVWNSLITSHENGWLLRWGLDDGSIPWAIHHHEDWVYEVDFGPEGYPLASSSRDGTLWYWAYPGANHFTVHGHEGEATSIATAGYDNLAFGADDNTVWIVKPALHIDEGGEQARLFGHTNWVWDVEYSADGEILASASADGTIRLWDAGEFVELRALEGHQGTVWRLAFAPHGAELASASWDFTARLWDPGTGRVRHTLEHAAPVWSVAYSPDGAMLATGSADGRIYLWRAGSGELLRILNAHASLVRGVEFSPDGRLIGSASADGWLRLWGVPPGA